MKLSQREQSLVQQTADRFTEHDENYSHKPVQNGKSDNTTPIQRIAKNWVAQQFIGKHPSSIPSSYADSRNIAPPTRSASRKR